MGFLSRFKKQPEQPTKEPAMGGKLMAYDSNIYVSSDFGRYNPDDLIIKKGDDVYERMMNDDQVKAVLAFKKSAVLSRGFYFDVESGNTDHEKIAEFFHFMLENMTGSFTDKIKAILSAYHNGFSISEKLWDSIDWEGSAFWAITDIKPKPFSTFIFNTDEYGEIQGLVQNNGEREITVDMDKVIHWVYQNDIDPLYGRSDLRACYRAWWSKDIVIKFQNIHLERHGSGLVVISAEEGADPTQKSAVEKILKNISARSGFFMPRGYKTDVHSPQKTDAFEKAIAQHDKAIAKATLVPNLLGLTEQGQTGSYSQSQTQFDVFLWVIDADTASLEESLNEQLFKEVAWVNFGTEDYPKFRMGELDAKQKESLAKTWAQLTKDKAVTNTKNDEAYTRQLLGYPELDEDAVEDNPDDETPPIPTDDEIIDQLPDGIDPEPFIHAFKERPWLRRVKFKQIDNSMNDIEAAFVKELNNTLGLVRLSLEKQIVKVAGDRSFANIELKEFDDLSIPKNLLSSIARDSRAHLQKMFNSGYTLAKAEIPKQEFKQTIGMDKTRADRFLSAKALKIKDVLNADVIKNIKQVMENGIKYDKTLKQIITELETNTLITSYLPEVDAAGRTVNVATRLENIVRTNTADAVNQSRMSLFGDPRLKGFVQAYEYSAILDQRVSDICETLNGRIKKDWGEYLPPNHFQCRSILIPVTAIDEWDRNEDNIPANVKPLQGFG